MLPHLTTRTAWLSAAAFFAGSINAVAGGGSLLSFPALLQAGILPIQANATNTVALLPGQFTSAAAYRRELRRHHSILLRLLIAAFAGGLLGARLLMGTKQEQFVRLVPWLLLTATVLFAAGPPLQKFLSRRTSAEGPLDTADETITPPVPAKNDVHPSGLRPLARILLPFCIFIVCLYIGYFGAGAGLLIMGVLSVAGVASVNEINALKTVITSVSNTVASLTFILFGAVLWHYCVLMMAAASLGGYCTARVARRRKPKWIRGFIVATGCVVTAYFFWKLH
ncbi:MAG TPA: sulfite exporter TauE/SafE family protein [Acidobacteriaceae bacterium]|nr:sulfite exporter TauE/SafE family protein [Acidobacteriaceae bacterium]